MSNTMSFNDRDRLLQLAVDSILDMKPHDVADYLNLSEAEAMEIYSLARQYRDADVIA